MKTITDFMTVPVVKLSFVDPISNERPQLLGSRDAADLIRPVFEDFIQHHEEMYAVILNRANRVLGVLPLGSGTKDGTQVNETALYQTLILSNASSCMLVHNHPSGNLMPSQADDLITQKIKQAVNLIGCLLLDHIILTTDSYYSYADEGRL